MFSPKKLHEIKAEAEPLQKKIIEICKGKRLEAVVMALKHAEMELRETAICISKKPKFVRFSGYAKLKIAN